MDRKQSDTPERPGPTSAEIPGERAFGAYTLVEDLGRGQLTSVHLARRTMKNGAQRRLVVKRILPHLTRKPEWGQLLVEEARLLSCIRHPNVVAALGAGTDDGGYIALEYVEGDSLEGLLARPEVPQQARLIAQVMADTLRGLVALHTACAPDGSPLAAVHQAPRPRHILVGTDGSARLIDFTQARARNLTNSRAGN